MFLGNQSRGSNNLKIPTDGVQHAKTPLIIMDTYGYDALTVATVEHTACSLTSPALIINNAGLMGK